MVVTSILATGPSGTLAATSARPACELLTAGAIARIVGETVHAGAPSRFIGPTRCNFPIGNDGLNRLFAVDVLPIGKCLSHRAAKVEAIRVGKRSGFYDTRTILTTPSATIHTPEVELHVGKQCVTVGWDRPSGPLPTGEAADGLRHQLETLAARAASRA